MVWLVLEAFFEKLEPMHWSDGHLTLFKPLQSNVTFLGKSQLEGQSNEDEVLSDFHRPLHSAHMSKLTA